MSFELIFILPLFVSLVGLGRIIIPRLKILKTLSLVEKEQPILSKIGERIKNLIFLRGFSFFQKFLKKIAILALFFHNKILQVEEKLISYLKNKDKKNKKDDFWSQIKKELKKDNNLPG